MKKVIESTRPVEDLQAKFNLDRVIFQSIWKNDDPNFDFHSASLLKSEEEHYLYVDFGLIGAVWEITSTGCNQLEQKDSLKERAEFVESMTNEPIIDRGNDND